MGKQYISCEGLVKIYKVADIEVVALQGLDLEIQDNEMLALVGPSGSGKSTLMNILGGLDTPTAGTAQVGNYNLLEMQGREQVRYRSREVGFVWQQTTRNLLPYLTAQENVELPMALAGQPGPRRARRSRELLDAVGLAERAHHRPERLSGGEQQRVALAVAMANRPHLLLADEPTGEVDSESAASIFEALRHLNQTYQVTIIIVTHDQHVARRVDRVVGIRDGRTSTETIRRRDERGVTIHEQEYVILDKVGRMQLPKPYIEKLGMKDRVKVVLETSHLGVWPDGGEKSLPPACGGD